MPLQPFEAQGGVIPVVVRSAADFNLTPDFVGIYNRYEGASPGSVWLDASLGAYPDDAEIIIRNASAANITIGFVTFTPFVSSALGLLVPIGGIAEIKRVNGTLVWDVYGYISS